MEVAQSCGVCAEERTNWAQGSCGHSICANCAYRMRFLYNDRNCAFCKEALGVVRVDPTRAGTHEWFLDDQSQMEFPTKKLLDHFVQLRKHQCRSCRQQFSSVQAVKNHLRHVHKRQFCEVCLNHRKVFLVEQAYYVDSTGSQPLQQGTAASSKNVSLRAHLNAEHPHCDFCRKHFYDEAALFDHLTKDHFSCSVCEGQGKSYQYFKNYAFLERHYRSDHFMCDEPQCRGVVYPNEIDLKLHIRQLHSGETSRSDRARQLTINLAELHGAAVAASASSSAASSGRRRERTVSNADLSRQRQNFSSENVVFRQDRAATAAAAAAGPSNGNAQPSRDLPNSSTYRREPALSPQKYMARPPPESPDETRERNRELVTSLRNQLDPASFLVFQDVSGTFRDGERSAKQFYDFCVETLGSSGSLQILPELIALLPEAHLRASLTDVIVLVHGVVQPNGDQQTNNTSAASHFPALGSRMGGPMVGGPWSGGQQTGVSAESDFPSLGGAGRPAQANWRRVESRRPDPKPKPSATSEAPAVGVQSDFPSLAGPSGLAAGDPSGRAGAVWNGAARQGKPKQRRRPPSPSPVGPTAASLAPVSSGSDAFPELEKPPVKNKAASSKEPKAASSREPKTASMPQGKVVDITALAAVHRKKVKNVPNIGSNGLPWEKKKARANIQAAKRDLMEKKKDGRS